MTSDNLIIGDYCITNDAGNKFVVYVDDACSAEFVDWYVSPSYSRPLPRDQWHEVIIGGPMITEETKKNELLIAEHMIANSFDYHNFDNGQYMLAESDGIWLCNTDDTKERKVTAETWIKPYIQECKTHSGFNAAIKERSIAKFTVSENYKHKILIRAMLHHSKALFTVTTEDGKTTYEITGYDRRK